MPGAVKCLKKKKKKTRAPVHILVLGHCTKDHGYIPKWFNSLLKILISTNKYKNSFVSKIKISIKTHTDDVWPRALLFFYVNFIFIYLYIYININAYKQIFFLSIQLASKDRMLRNLLLYKNKVKKSKKKYGHFTVQNIL